MYKELLLISRITWPSLKGFDNSSEVRISALCLVETLVRKPDPATRAMTIDADLPRFREKKKRQPHDRRGCGDVVSCSCSLDG